MFSYGRRAYADCTVVSSPDYLCSGVTATTQTITADGATVTTDAGFDLNVASGNGLVISGNGAISFTDTNKSSIAAASGSAIVISSNGDDGLTPGSVDVNINGDLYSSSFAINASNAGSGALSITSTGNIYSSGVPIIVSNSGTDVTIKVNNVEGHFGGFNNYGAIHASNSGSGELYISATGDVYGGRNGIVAFNYNSSDGDLTINVDGSVTGHNYRGIDARQGSDGDLSITVGQDITASEHGIVARNLANSNNLSIDVQGDINAGGMGIVALHRGTGALDITTEGGISGTQGIRAMVYAASSSYIHVNDVTATNFNGINANVASGSVDIKLDGTLTSQQTGILAYMHASATDLNINTAAGSSITITGSGDGISASNRGTGTSTVTVDGDIDALNLGVYISSYKGSTVNVGKTATISGKYVGIYAYNKSGSESDISVAAGASVDATSGTGIFIYHGGGRIDTHGDVGGYIAAIQFSQLESALDLNIYGGHITGDVIDNNAYRGYSTVNVMNDFTSEGDFYVSSLNVGKGAVFTPGAGYNIETKNGLNIDGTLRSVYASGITGDVTVRTGGTLDVQIATSIVGSLENSGTVSIASGTTLGVNTMNAGSGGTLNFDVVSDSDHGMLVVNYGPADLTGQKIAVNLSPSNTVDATTKFVLIDGDSTVIGGPGTGGTKVSDNSLAWDFRIISGDGITDDSDIFLVASKAVMGSTTNNTNAGDTLIALDGTSDPDLSTIITNLTNASTPAAQDAILEAVQPAMDGAIAVATLTFADSAMNLTGERLRDLRMAGNGMAGVSAGSAPSTGVRVWTQATGWTADQGRRKGIAGYDADTFAATFGADTDRLFDNGIVGLAFSYGKTNINSQNATRTGTDIDSYQLTLYSDHNWGDGYYLTGMAGYAFNTNSTVRHDVGGTPGLTAYGDFNSQQLAMRAEMGRAYKAGCGVYITPMMLTDWVYYNADSYTETGAGGAGLHVDSKALNTLDVGIGTKAAMRFRDRSGGELVPELSAAYRYDVVGDNLETTSTFIGGGPAFKGQGPDPARHKFTLGAQIKYYSAGNLELTAAYNLDFKQDYTANAALLRAGWKF